MAESSVADFSQRPAPVHVQGGRGNQDEADKSMRSTHPDSRESAGFRRDYSDALRASVNNLAVAWTTGITEW